MKEFTMLTDELIDLTDDTELVVEWLTAESVEWIFDDELADDEF